MEESEKEELEKSTILKSKEEILKIEEWINPNKKIKFNLLYKASIDGDSIIKFHEKCDNKGPTLIIIKIKTGYRFGGYNPLSWNTQNNYKEHSSTFIFSLDKMKKYNLKKIKFNILLLWMLVVLLLEMDLILLLRINVLKIIFLILKLLILIILMKNVS